MGDAANGIPRNWFTSTEPEGPATFVVVPIMRPAAIVAVGVAQRASDTSSALTKWQIAASNGKSPSLICIVFSVDIQSGAIPLSLYKRLLEIATTTPCRSRELEFTIRLGGEADALTNQTKLTQHGRNVGQASPFSS